MIVLIHQLAITQILKVLHLIQTTSALLDITVKQDLPLNTVSHVQQELTQTPKVPLLLLARHARPVTIVHLPVPR